MSDATTPLMSQYRDIKRSHSDCILLFRVGDFYETFYEDAVDIAGILNITLTTRDKNKPNPIPLAGVPFHAAETYITRLLAAGRKVAVCEQVEDPALAKGLVRREVVEVLTPGTALNAQLVADADNNYCLGVFPTEDGMRAVALIDVGTGECACGEAHGDAYLHLIQGKRIRELVVPAAAADELRTSLAPHLGNPFLTALSDDEFDLAPARAALAAHFGDGAEALVGALTPGEAAVTGALVRHCLRLRGGVLPQVVTVTRLGAAPFLSLDEETIANLELFEPLRGGVQSATLLRTLDRTLTPMGARALRHWIQRPLCDVARIDERLDAVARVHSDAGMAELLVRALKGVADVQRLSARIASRKAIPRELHALRESLEKIPGLAGVVGTCGTPLLESAGALLGDHAALCGEIERAIVAEPPAHLREGGVIRRGFDADLDRLIDESESARKWIASLEARERERSGIASLKVGYNKVFGYYIEVSNAHAKAVPADYVGKQTLVNAQRFFTSELKEKEDLILSTEERRVREEQRVFDGLCASIATRAAALQRTAQAMATIDAIQSLAMTARAHGYRRPMVDDSLALEIVGGRHPVLERVVSEAFVPNDLDLDVERRQFALITGPNMSGKSTFLRQTALIVLMAQTGIVRPRRARARGGGGPHLHPRGCRRPAVARRVDLPGGDERNRGHPAPRDQPQPGHPGRDRPRHVDVRRPLHCLGGDRAPPAGKRGATAHALRHALPRADAVAQFVPAPRQPEDRHPRVGGWHRVPAQDRPGYQRPQLRHPRRAGGGAAAVGDPPRRGDPGVAGVAPQPGGEGVRPGRVARPDESLHAPGRGARRRVGTPRPHRRLRRGQLHPPRRAAVHPRSEEPPPLTPRPSAEAVSALIRPNRKPWSANCLPACGCCGRGLQLLQCLQ